MTAADLAVLAAVGLGLFFALRSGFRGKGGCSGNCADCCARSACSACRNRRKSSK